MKHAILITAYKNYEHLLELVHYFNGDWFDIYIHLDKKSEINKNQISSLYQFRSVKLISSKYKVNWGGVNHLKSYLFLSKVALSNKEIGYFHLITGHDFPIKPISEFLSFFENKNGKEFIDYFEFTSDVSNSSKLGRIQYYQFCDLLNYKTKIGRNITYWLIRLQELLSIKRNTDKYFTKLYGGLTYWSLSKECLNYVIQYTENDNAFLKRMNYTFCSEEIYFQTIILNSPFSKDVVNDHLRFLDRNHRNGNCPANLDETDFDKIIKSDKLFARKFETKQSLELLLKLKKVLQG